MSHWDFMGITEDDAWKFLDEMMKKTMQWEGFNEKSSTTLASKGGIHSIKNFIAVEAKLAALMRKNRGSWGKEDSSAARPRKSDLCTELFQLPFFNSCVRRLSITS